MRTVSHSTSRSIDSVPLRTPVWTVPALLLGSLSAVLLAASPCLAQFSMVESLAPRFEWRGHLEADYQGEFETKTDGGDEFESWRVGLAGGFGGPLNEAIGVGFQARYQRADYDFHLDNGVSPTPNYGTNEFPKEPWGGLDTIDLTPTTTILVGDHFSVVAAVPIRWSGEVGSERNGFVAGISAVAGFQVFESFRFGIGIGVTSQLEGSAEAFPVVVLDWQVAEGLRLATEGNWSQGGSAALYWQSNEAVDVSFSVGYERNRFRLDDNGTLPDTNGVGEITAIPIEVGLRVHIIEGAFLDLRAGLGVAGRFRVEDDRGRKLYDQNYDPAPRIRVGVRIPIGRVGAGRAQADAPYDDPNDGWGDDYDRGQDRNEAEWDTW